MEFMFGDRRRGDYNEKRAHNRLDRLTLKPLKSAEVHANVSLDFRISCDTLPLFALPYLPLA
jgi:hypothetical protein